MSGKAESKDKAKIDNQAEKNRKKAAIIIICLLAIVLIALLCVIFLLLQRSKPDSIPQREAYTIDEENYQQILEDMDKQVEDGYFETYMTTEWTFPDGNSESTDAMLGNSPNNTKPIRCELLLDETGEKLFETSVLPVGSLVSSVKLNRDLDAGTYEATCMIYLMSEQEDGTFVDYSNAGFRVTLTIEK